MKTIIRFSLLLFISLSACSTQNTSITGECVRVTLLRNMCGNAILKIEDPAYFMLGENVDGEKNVFLGFVECSDVNLSGNTIPTMADGTQLYVELNPKDYTQECTTCLAMINYSGKRHYKVRIKENCNAPNIED